MNETLDALQSLLVAPVATPAAAIVWALIGLVVGSFLNVVIHRIPQMMQRESDNYMAMENDEPPPHADRYNLLAPRSACPACGHTAR